jgi:hypothetical protein
MNREVLLGRAFAKYLHLEESESQAVVGAARPCHPPAYDRKSRPKSFVILRRMPGYGLGERVSPRKTGRRPVLPK